MSHPGTILVVDDEAIGRASLESLLGVHGYAIAQAASGGEALEKALELTPDLVLLDILMPDMDGFEVCRRLRADPILAEVPIIMVTALDDSDSRIRGIEAGADDFVSKPFDTLELQARVNTIMRLSRFRQLLSERAKFEWLVEQSDEGYVMVSPEDRLIYANPRARLYLGLPEESAGTVNEPFLKLARRQYQCEPREVWESWPQQPDILPSPRYLVRAESASAKALWLRVDVLDLRAGPQGGWLIRLRDVTEKISLQHDMWKFHAAIFHKLRTPASTMSSSLDLLVRHSARLTSEQIVELSTTAMQNLRRLQEELEDILQYMNAPSVARPGTGVRVMDLLPMVTGIAHDLGLNPVSLSIHDVVQEWQLTIAPRNLELILREILQNSQKFHPRHDPKIRVRVLRASFQEISIEISDDGATLSPDQLAQVWTPYYQGEKHFSGEVTGMGLGLPMVAALIWEAGGTSRIFNHPGGPGVSVELVLPADKVAPPLAY